MLIRHTLDQTPLYPDAITTFLRYHYLREVVPVFSTAKHDWQIRFHSFVRFKNTFLILLFILSFSRGREPNVRDKMNRNLYFFGNKTIDNRIWFSLVSCGYSLVSTGLAMLRGPYLDLHLFSYSLMLDPFLSPFILILSLPCHIPLLPDAIIRVVMVFYFVFFSFSI